MINATQSKIILQVYQDMTLGLLQIRGITCCEMNEEKKRVKTSLASWNTVENSFHKTSVTADFINFPTASHIIVNYSFSSFSAFANQPPINFLFAY